jgi:2,3-dihydroxybenzoate---[aryl-carrier protein] ligase
MLDGCTPYPEEFAERYVREGYWSDETIHEAVAAAARSHPHDIALIDARRRIRFAELAEETERVAALLADNGLRRDDRIIVQIPNRIELITLTLACFRIGAVPVMTLPAFRRAELEHLIGLSGAKAIAIAPEYRGFDHAALSRELRGAGSTLQTIFSTVAAPGTIAVDASHATAPRAGTPARVGPRDVAVLLLSGGTTGLPKLIPRTHTDYLYAARASARICGFDRSSRLLIVIPAVHNFALGAPGIIGALLTGATSILSESARPEDVVNTIAAEEITHLPCVPAVAIGLLELAGSRRSELASLRVITVGGQRLQEPTARGLRQALPSLTVQQVLGMTEGLLCYTRLDDPDDVACATQGRPISDADEIRIVRADGTPCAPGEVGELWCRGPYNIRGYYRGSPMDQEVFTADGFYRSGDLVRLAPSGNLIVEGRIKDQINRGGEKISAEEVEAHLMAHPAVAAAAVVAMPDAALGERACAYVTLRGGATFEIGEMRVFLESRGVARYKWPERIEVLAAMPLTNVGKIRKAELRRDVEAKLAAERHARNPARRAEMES